MEFTVTNYYLKDIKGDLVGRTFVGRLGIVKILVVKETNCYVDFRELYEDGDSSKIKRAKKGLCGDQLCIGLQGKIMYETIVLSNEGE